MQNRVVCKADLLQDIQQRLSSEYEASRETAVRSLIMAQISEAVTLLFPILESDASAKVRALAALAIGILACEVHLEESVLALCKAMEDPDPWVRKHATAALKLLSCDSDWISNNSLVVEKCLNALNDPESHVVMAAVYVLRETTQNEVNSHLVALLNHPNCWVRLSAVEALIERGYRSAELSHTLDLLQREFEINNYIMLDCYEFDNLTVISSRDFFIKLRTKMEHNLC